MSEDWLARLKVGDRVGIRHTHYTHTNIPSPGKVVRITPSGRIVAVRNGRSYEITFNPDGRERTSDRWPQKLVEWTPERQAAHNKTRLIDRLACAKWEKLPLATLEAVAALLAEGERDAAEM